MLLSFINHSVIVVKPCPIFPIALQDKRIWNGGGVQDFFMITSLWFVFRKPNLSFQKVNYLYFCIDNWAPPLTSHMLYTIPTRGGWQNLSTLNTSSTYTYEHKRGGAWSLSWTESNNIIFYYQTWIPPSLVWIYI